MLAAATLDDESYLDAVEGLYEVARRVVGPAASRAAAARLADAPDVDGSSIDALRERLDGLPAVAVRNRLYRSTQEMMWRRITSTYERRRAELEALLAAAARDVPGLHLDPGLALPPYYAGCDFHLQPGSYHGDALAGFWYHYGSKIVFLGQNDLDQIHATAAALAPPPRDGDVGRVLDLGCSIGQSATALKSRFPAARVEAIDVSAAMLTYAHWRASRIGARVTFRQRRAESTGFDANSFDVVYAFLLFHELPTEVRSAVVEEAHRLLRPGGVMVIVDNATGEASMTPFRRYTSDFSRRFNGEAYTYDFDTGDFAALLRASSFGHVEELVFAADVQLPFAMWMLRR
jgi:ubiquinone/menaquinone biosynthesis C-methylase UbiE